MTAEISYKLKKDSFLFLGTTNQRKHLPSIFRSLPHISDVLGRCWCFYLQCPPPPSDHHLSHNKKHKNTVLVYSTQMGFKRQLDVCEGDSWKATVSSISNQLIIVSLAYSEIMIPIDKESRLLIASHFIIFAPSGTVGCHGSNSYTACH